MPLRPRIKNIRQAKDHEFLNLEHLGMIAGGEKKQKVVCCNCLSKSPRITSTTASDIA